ncbi:hypothetical protein KKA85_04095, partial [bacterium]|nr:hypothetical protein [bacterium]
LRDQAVEGRTERDDAVLRATDRDRRSQDYRAVLTHTGLARARLQLSYRYRISDLDETVARDGLPGSGLEGDSQTTAQDRTDQEAGFRGRYRLGRGASLKARVTWRKTEVEQLDTWDTASGEPWLYWMGDREREQLRWQVSVQTRPLRSVRLDLGHQAVDQTFTRRDAGDAETTWRALRGYAACNWLVSDRLTLLGTVSLGLEEYALTGAAGAAAGMAPLVYDGTTLRFAPGASLRLSDTLHVEGFYEGVRHEDQAGAAGPDDDVNADLDRVLVRADWRFVPELTLQAAYRHHEFAENRWDDYSLDLYALSLSGAF